MIYILIPMNQLARIAIVITQIFSFHSDRLNKALSFWLITHLRIVQFLFRSNGYLQAWDNL